MPHIPIAGKLPPAGLIVRKAAGAISKAHALGIRTADHPLLAFDQVILTPHTAGLTTEAAERMAISSVQNILDFFAGRLDPALIVNAKFL